MPRNIRFDRLRKQLSGLLLACVASLIGSHPAQAQASAGKPPQSIRFADTTYQLAFQAHPSPGYSQYAYLPKGQKLPYYRTMLMLEFLSNGVTPEEAAELQIDSLEERKENGDLSINHRLIQNPASGEYLLDFVASSADEKMEFIVEWNAYRYSAYTNEDDEDGVQIFGYSTRGYGADGGRDFLLDLKQQRQTLIQTLASAEVPKLSGH